MSNFIKSTIESVAAAVAVVALLALPATASADAEKAAEEARARGMVMTMEAEVTAVDLETRQVSLKGPTGETVFMMSSRPPYAPTGMPPPMILPSVVMSGVTPYRPCAQFLCTRKPVMTSSKIRTTPWVVQRSRRPCR